MLFEASLDQQQGCRIGPEFAPGGSPATWRPCGSMWPAAGDSALWSYSATRISGVSPKTLDTNAFSPAPQGFALFALPKGGRPGTWTHNARRFLLTVAQCCRCDP